MGLLKVLLELIKLCTKSFSFVFYFIQFALDIALVSEPVLFDDCFTLGNRQIYCQLAIVVRFRWEPTTTRRSSSFISTGRNLVHETTLAFVLVLRLVCVPGSVTRGYLSEALGSTSWCGLSLLLCLLTTIYFLSLVNVLLQSLIIHIQISHGFLLLTRWRSFELINKLLVIHF